jgi:hypothetical protein
MPPTLVAFAPAHALFGISVMLAACVPVTVALNARPGASSASIDGY